MRRMTFAVVALSCLFVVFAFSEPSGPAKLGVSQAFAADAATPFAISQNSVLNDIQKRNKLVVGMEVEYWPFEYADESGAPTGFDVALAKLAAQELGVELEIKDMEWTGLIPALQGGQLDLIISGMTATLQRAKTITFSDPYFITGLTVLASSQRAPGLASVWDLNADGRVLALKTGTTGDLWASQHLPKATIKRFKDETACVREVVTGRADAFLYDQISVAKHLAQNAETTYALLEPFTYEPFAMAMRKGDFDFWQWMSQFLRTIRADGRYKAAFQEFLGPVLGPNAAQ